MSSKNKKQKRIETEPSNSIATIGHNNPPKDIIYSGKLAVIGSRVFQNFKYLCEILDEHLVNVTALISGGADGADKMGARWARKRGIETKIFEPNHKKFKHAYHHRNRLIAEECDFLIAFWNGNSTGTKYTIDYAKKMGKPVIVIKF